MHFPHLNLFSLHSHVFIIIILTQNLLIIISRSHHSNVEHTHKNINDDTLKIKLKTISTQNTNQKVSYINHKQHIMQQNK